MRLKGTVAEMDDDRRFGFIEHAGGGERVSSVKMDSRLRGNDGEVRRWHPLSFLAAGVLRMKSH